MTQKSMTETETTGNGFSVAASPLNRVKFELGVIICVGAMLWLAVDSITANVVEQLLILFVYGLGGMVWLMARTRKIVKSVTDDKPEDLSGDETHGA